MTNLRKVNAFLMLIATYLLISPFIHSYLPIAPLFIIIAILIIFISFLIGETQYSNSTLLIILYSLVFSFTVLSFYWQELLLVLYPKYLLLSFLIVWSIDRGTHILFIRYSTWLLLLQCFLALIGFVYALLGGTPTFDVTIGWGREFNFYLTSFSVTNYVGFIRPSALFDEPGALSFFICFVVVMREVYSLSRKFSVTILFFGMITLSLAHFVFTLLFVLYLAFLKKKWIEFFVFSLSICVLIVFLTFSVKDSFILDYLVNRSSSDIEGGRAQLLNNAFNIVSSGDYKVFLFGVDSNCLLDYIDNCRYTYPAMGENVLSLLAFSGFATSWFYYFFLVVITGFTFFYPKKMFPLFLLSILFWQRPVIYMIGYSITFSYLVYEFLHFFKKGGTYRDLCKVD
jgi:hypothetical protein